MSVERIDIPNPCHKVQWDDMAKVAQGRHCTMCDRTVVDFTAMDKEDIIKVLSCGGKVCGSFTTLQFERLNTPLKVNTSVWRRMAAAAVVLVCSLPFFRSEAKVRSGMLQEPLVGDGKLIEIAKDTVKTIAVSGIVTDHEADPLKGCLVSSTDKKYQTVTDSLGRFKLTLPDTAKQFNVVFLGFVSKAVKINKKPGKQYRIVLDAWPNVIGEVRIDRH